MKTTKELLARRFQNKQVAICKECKGVSSKFSFDIRDTDKDGIREVGLRCPKCNHWYHSYFIDKWLEDNRPNPKANRTVRREYKKKFIAYQKRIRKKFGLRKVNGQWLFSE